MNDQGILEQLAQHPNSRAVQLADRLDLDLEDVQGSLAGLVAVGDVTATPGMSPAGNACQFYDLSVTFKASEAYKPIAIKAAAAAFAAAHIHLDQVGRAVAFVRERGTASSYELHVVMGLEPGQIASSALVHALADGRLSKAGKNWTLGPASEQAPFAEEDLGMPHATGGIISAADSHALIEGMVSPERLPMAIDVPTFLPQQELTQPLRATQKPRRAPAKDQPAPRAPATVLAPVYRCALWSDGILEVRRDGETVAEIPQAAGESVAAFLRRLVRAGAPA